MRQVRAAALGAAAAVAAAEWAHWWAYRRLGRPYRLGRAYRLGRPEAEDGSEVIVVLGYPTRRNGRLHPVQRWRVRIAVRSIEAGRPTTLVFTGAGPGGRLSEAAVMATWAQELGVGAADVVLEEQARSTWENIAHTLGHMAAADRIKIASDPIHALRAQRYLTEMAPELAARLVPAATYRPWEHPGLKVAVALYEGLARAWFYG